VVCVRHGLEAERLRQSKTSLPIGRDLKPRLRLRRAPASLDKNLTAFASYKTREVRSDISTRPQIEINRVARIAARYRGVVSGAQQRRLGLVRQEKSPGLSAAFFCGGQFPEQSLIDGPVGRFLPILTGSNQHARQRDGAVESLRLTDRNGPEQDEGGSYLAKLTPIWIPSHHRKIQSRDTFPSEVS
jgi:hypothetical protein